MQRFEHAAGGWRLGMLAAAIGAAIVGCWAAVGSAVAADEAGGEVAGAFDAEVERIVHTVAPLARRGGVEADDREQALAVLRRRLLSDDAALARLSATEFEDAFIAAVRLGLDDAGEQFALFSRWVSQSDEIAAARPEGMTFLLRFAGDTQGSAHADWEQTRDDLVAGFEAWLAGVPRADYPRKDRVAAAALLRDIGALAEPDELERLAGVLREPAVAAELLPDGMDLIVDEAVAEPLQQAALAAWADERFVGMAGDVAGGALVRAYRKGLDREGAPTAKSRLMVQGAIGQPEAFSTLVEGLRTEGAALDRTTDEMLRAYLQARGVNLELFDTALGEVRSSRGNSRMAFYADLSAFAGSPRPYEKGLGDLAVRRAVRRYHDAPATERRKVWEQSIGQEIATARWLRYSPATLEAVDSIIADLGAEQALVVLNDLVLLAPDVESMRSIQWRRIAMLEELGEPAAAAKAAALDVVLAMTTEEGRVWPALERSHELSAAAGNAPAGDATLLAAFSAVFGESAEPQARAASRLADSHLSQRGEQLSEVVGESPPLRHAWIGAISGQSDAVLTAMRQAWEDSDDVADQVQLLAWAAPLAAIHDGHAAAMHGLAQQITWQRDGEGFAARLGDEVLEGATLTPRLRDHATSLLLQHGDRMWELGEDARAAGHRELAAVAYRQAVHDQERTATDHLQARVREHGEAWRNATDRRSSDALLDMVESIEAAATTPEARLYLAGERAGILYAAGHYAQAAEAMEQALAAARQEALQPDPHTAFVYAMAMIRSEQHNSARELLQDMQDTLSRDADRARALFLLAWIHLHEDRLDEARPLLEQIVNEHRASELHERAGQVLSRLQRL